jgi:hypothetical protein
MAEGPTQLTAEQLTKAIAPHASTHPSDEDLAFYQSAAEAILNSYPNAGIHDIEAYLRVLRETLLHFGRVTAEKIAEPRTGIITKHDFPPTVAQLHKFVNPDPVPQNKRHYSQPRFREETEKPRTSLTAEEREDGYHRLKALAQDLRSKNAEPPHIPGPKTRVPSHQAIRANLGMPLELEEEA